MPARNKVGPTRLHADEHRQLRAQRQGRGTGERETYLPWFQLRRGDFVSRGRASYSPSALFERHHELLSALERTALHCLQLLNPHDIREQFPLQLYGVEEEFCENHPDAQGTVEIGRAMGVKHPLFREGDFKFMSTDFVVSRRSGKGLAVHVKYVKDLEDSRGAELRAIEAEYWSQRGFDICVFTEKEIGRTAKNNLILLQSYDRRQPQVLDSVFLRDVAELGSILPMNKALRQLSSPYGRTYPDLVDLVKYAVVTGRLILDLSIKNLSWSQIWPNMTVHPCVEQEADLMQLEMEGGAR
ncbi:TnsA endonuclease N-terminal domain-containing protein [Ramlibacter sp. AN1015]|uniref:TnsA endonuclease N-terminal domain-containing protein n=1 Tax=Ramlibacter sp. AN1015 TaxID=3133428 RepID=UPI0030BE8034